jgi:dihydrofolate synthase/folylpolyglutamate synthase
VVHVGLEDTVQYLYGLQKFGTKLGLDNTRALLGLLGNPEKGKKFLHVTGTNGKGSVSSLAASALTRAGHRTGLYTSPHLVSFTERMKVDGVQATEQDVISLAGRLRELLEKGRPDLRPTFFEFTTAMALDYFDRKGADVVALEVGMGGRLDSTNVVTPVCSVITNVELEHREYLGDTILDIAFEKAGIIKPGVPLVTSERKPEVVGFLEETCRKMGAPMYLLGRDFGFRPEGFRWEGGAFRQTMDYFGPGGDIEGLEIQLIGDHQLENAATATCALGIMSDKGIEVPAGAVREGFKEARWEGRLEVVSTGPLVVLDGAHNPASAGRLAEAVVKYFTGRYRRLILVMGVLADKDIEAMACVLAPLADSLVLTQASYERAVPAAGLMAHAASLGADAVLTDTVADAMALAVKSASPDDMVLVTGSLYVVGEAKAWIDKTEPFLKA